jgi:opacity protein-like surface antigen
MKSVNRLDGGRVFTLTLLVIAASAAVAQEPNRSTASGVQGVAKVEIFAGYSYLNSGPERARASESGLHGGVASVNVNLRPWLGLTAEFSRHARSNRYFFLQGSQREEVSVTTLLAGPRLAWRPNGNATVFGHTLAGASRYRNELEYTLLSPPSSGQFSFKETRFAAAFGGGMDLKVTDRLAWRAVQADYLVTRNYGRATNNLRLSIGPVFRLGRK